jgi:hypothetical protein
MDIFWEILKITLPALLVAGTACFSIRILCEKELKKQLLDLKFNSKQMVNPIRLQAYERLALLLERMKPENLLLRNQAHPFSASQYRTILLTSLRNEFDHNLSQQVYVSGALWETTKKAKEEITKAINLATAKTGADATGNELATTLLDIYLKLNPAPTDVALELLRQEIKELY